LPLPLVALPPFFASGDPGVSFDELNMLGQSMAMHKKEHNLCNITQQPRIDTIITKQNVKYWSEGRNGKEWERIGDDSTTFRLHSVAHANRQRPHLWSLWSLWSRFLSRLLQFSGASHGKPFLPCLRSPW
jgi:hypothetical protein